LELFAHDGHVAGVDKRLDAPLNPHMAIAECYLLDVGQGTSNVILLGDRRAIVIDCGRSASVHNRCYGRLLATRYHSPVEGIM
jgi:hypothetical protein